MSTYLNYKRYRFPIEMTTSGLANIQLLFGYAPLLLISQRAHYVSHRTLLYDHVNLLLTIEIHSFRHDETLELKMEKLKSSADI